MLRKKRMLLFYYPQHFNRTVQGTNPFFDRLLETCGKRGISYHLIEEPDWSTDKPRNSNAIKGDAFFVLVMVVRKLVNKCFRGDFWQNERKVAKVVNFLTFGRLKYKTYITISGSMIHLFSAMNDRANVYDMQHGILYKQHPTFFDKNEKLRPQYYKRELHWLMWGSGYDQCFCRGEDNLLDGRTHVVGYPMNDVKVKIDKSGSKEKVILFSLQFTHDWQPSQLQEAKLITDEALQQLADKHVKILLKHHPRYSNSIAIDDIMEKYEFVKMTELSMQELIPITMLQVTINSTTAFEYARMGIPTFFIDQKERIPLGNLFYQEYSYPLYHGNSLTEVVERLQNPEYLNHDSIIVKNWYREFYDDFNEEAFVKLLK